MKTIRLAQPLEHDAAAERPCVLALGFFDGLHLAHRALFDRAARIAGADNLELAVMTFDPHPRQVVGHSPEPMKVLTPLRTKERILSGLGIDRLYIVHFDELTSRLTPQQFLRQYLMRLQVRHVVAGFDFRFGHRGEGDIAMLRNAATGFFEVHMVEELRHGGRKISSSLIRKLVAQGLVHLVPEYLGQYYEIAASKLARHKFLADDLYVLPKSGVYRIEMETGGGLLYGSCSIADSGEIDILNRADDMYSFGETAAIRLLKRLEPVQQPLPEAEMRMLGAHLP